MEILCKPFALGGIEGALIGRVLEGTIGGGRREEARRGPLAVRGDETEGNHRGEGSDDAGDGDEGESSRAHEGGDGKTGGGKNKIGTIVRGEAW